jgi:hypothetical protein
MNKIFGVELLLEVADEPPPPPLQLAITKHKLKQKQIDGLPNVRKRLNKVGFIMVFS